MDSLKTERLEESKHNQETMAESLIKFFSKSAKIFSIKLFIKLILERHLLLNNEFSKFFSSLFDKDSLFQSIILSSISLLHSLFKRIPITKTSKTMKSLISILSVLLPSLFLQVNQTFKGVILILLLKIVNELIHFECQKRNLMQEESKLRTYLIYSVPTTLFYLAMLFNPNYEYVTNYIEKYSNYVDEERLEFANIVEHTKLV